MSHCSYKQAPTLGTIESLIRSKLTELTYRQLHRILFMDQLLISTSSREACSRYRYDQRIQSDR